MVSKPAALRILLRSPTGQEYAGVTACGNLAISSPSNRPMRRRPPGVRRRASSRRTEGTWSGSKWTSEYQARMPDAYPSGTPRLVREATRNGMPGKDACACLMNAGTKSIPSTPAPWSARNLVQWPGRIPHPALAPPEVRPSQLRASGQPDGRTRPTQIWQCTRQLSLSTRSRPLHLSCSHLMLAPTPALERLAGQERHVEGIQDRDRLGELVGGGSLESGFRVEGVIAGWMLASASVPGQRCAAGGPILCHRPQRTSSRTRSDRSTAHPIAQVKDLVALDHHVGILQQVLCVDRPEVALAGPERRRRRSETAPRGPSLRASAGASRRPRGRHRPEASRPSRPSCRRRGDRRLSPRSGPSTAGVVVGRLRHLHRAHADPVKARHSWQKWAWST
ncbi:hypothetical protein AHiyo4_48940 [Arthrobacter sp. Hiyo4]|nr:hypothetical protein AHiyo4_48940 [Arthrobacter sp. Hiyo4]